jgi:biopolymer transport protein ExbB
LTLACLALGVAWTGQGRPAIAEEAAEEVESEDSEPPPAGATQQPTTPAQGDSQSGGDEVRPEMSYLEYLFRGLGVMYSIIFLLLSFILVGLFVMCLIQARRVNMAPPALIEEFEGLLNEKKYQEAYELAKADESMLGQVLSAGLAKLSTGYPAAVEAMQEVGEEENMKLEHRLSYIALIGTISPMFGLLGTVQGMIGAFETLAKTNTGAPDPQELADNIALALFTTLVGLWLAIPAIAAHSILRNRFSRLVMEVGVVSEGLMNRFQPQPAKKA